MIRKSVLVLALIASGVNLTACGDDESAGGSGGSGGGACAADADCAGARCGPAGACVECLESADCGGRPCVAGACTSCALDTDCAAPTGRCDPVTGACAGCLTEGDCTAPQICTADRTCANECAGDADCASQAGTFCDLAGIGDAPASFRCTLPQNPPCDGDGDCDANEVCLANECRCDSDLACNVGESCVDNDCVAVPSCATDADCAALGRVCESVQGARQCIEACVADGDCGIGQSCAGGHCQQQCAGDATCLRSETICEGNLCVPAECVTLADCGAGELCSSEGHGRCTGYTTCTSDAECTDPNFRCGDPRPCPPGFDCDATDICVEREACVSDNDCSPGQFCQELHCRDGSPCGSRADCDPTEDCVADICVPFFCRGDADCSAGPGEICVAGVCGQPPTPDTVSEIRILTIPRPLGFGEQVQLVAIALASSGQGIPGQRFEWASSDANVAAVDADGLLTAGAVPGGGRTDLTAALQITAGRRVVSQPVTFRVHEAPAAGDACVVAFDGATGFALAGATVVLDGLPAVATGVDGAACFAGASAATHEAQFYLDGYDRVALVQAPGDHLAISARPSLARRAAGFTGTISMAQVTSSGGLDIGLAGTSRDELLGMTLSSLLGDVFVQHLQTPFGNFDAPVPGGLTLNVTNPLPLPVKSTVYAVSDPGLRAIWSFAGRVDTGTLGIGQGGGANPGDVIARIFPYFGTFEHGLTSEVMVDVPRVTDAADLDGDGDVTEKLPDYLNGAFPSLNLRPATQQGLRVELDVPPLPSLRGEPLTTTILLAAAKVPQIGYTPLGLSSATDEDGDGLVDPQVMKMTPLYSGLEAGSYATAAMAVRVPQGQSTEFPPEVSARIFADRYLPAQVQFQDDAFLPFAEAAQWDGATRSIGLDAADAVALAAAGAEVMRIVIEGPDGRWLVYLPVDAVGAAIPAPPAGFEALDPADPAQTTAVWAEPISVQPGVTWSELSSVGGATVGDLDALADGYSRVPVQ